MWSIDADFVLSQNLKASDIFLKPERPAEPALTTKSQSPSLRNLILSETNVQSPTAPIDIICRQHLPKHVHRSNVGNNENAFLPLSILEKLDPGLTADGYSRQSTRLTGVGTSNRGT
jgi:hypothetical protein